jgi:hypothetical protein
LDVSFAHHGATQDSNHLNRAIADDGTRVFFATAQALVASDTNGTSDVYEWEQNGAGGCQNPRGCLSLLSSGKDSSPSYFLDASRSGNDAFFLTREQLVGWDRDDAYDVYDARVGGGFANPPVAPPACGSSAACQGEGTTAPEVAMPGSALLTSTGRAAVPKPKPKPARCKRGFVKKKVKGKVRCVKQKRRPRRAGKATAHTRRAK